MWHEIYLTEEDIKKLQNGGEVEFYPIHDMKYNQKVVIRKGDKEKLFVRGL